MRVKSLIMQISVAERAEYSIAFESHERSLNYTDKMLKKPAEFSLVWAFLSHSQNIQIVKQKETEALALSASLPCFNGNNASNRLKFLPFLE